MSNNQEEKMTERCEPPPEWRGVDHDCYAEVTFHNGAKELQTFRWVAEKQGFAQGGLLCYASPRNPVHMDIGHTICRYIAPITPPATVTALVEALEECADDLDAEISSRYSSVRHYKRDMEPVIRARAALAAYREGGR